MHVSTLKSRSARSRTQGPRNLRQQVLVVMGQQTPSIIRDFTAVYGTQGLQINLQANQKHIDNSLFGNHFMSVAHATLLISQQLNPVGILVCRFGCSAGFVQMTSRIYFSEESRLLKRKRRRD